MGADLRNVTLVNRTLPSFDKLAGVVMAELAPMGLL